MTSIESRKVIVNSSCEKIFSFFSNLNNFQKIMPEQVINWQSTENTCSFTIKGICDLNMHIVEKIPDSKIIIESQDKKPFDYNLEFSFNNSEDDKCSAQIIFNADLNPLIKMMAETPLQNFVNILADNLSKLF